VIDVVAPTLPALLDRIDGRTTVPKKFVLHTKSAELTTVKMSFWKRLLDALIDPNLISLMLSLGVLGLVVELWHPGLIFPATFGILCLAIAFYGLDVLPVNWAGLLLMLAAFALWITELFVPVSHGALSVAGAACFIFGALLLFEPAGSNYHVSWGLIVGIAVAFSLFFVFALASIVRIRHRPATTGARAMVGAQGRVGRYGKVAVKGELWQARDAEGEPLQPGDEVEVVDTEGLSLVVRHTGTRMPA